MADSQQTNDLQSRFELKTVLETSRMLIESRSSDFILKNLLFIVMGKLLTPRSAILIYQPETDNYRIEKAKGLKVDSEGDILSVSLNAKEKDCSHFFYRNFKSELPQLTGSEENSVFFPLRTSDHHIGFLFIGGKANGQPYLNRELEFVESLTIITSVAIFNSELFDELKLTNRKLDRRIHELNTLLDLSKEFNLLTDREKIARIFKFALLGQLFVRTFFLIYKTPESAKILASSGLVKNPTKSEIDGIFKDCPVDVLKPNDQFKEKHSFIKLNKISHLVGVSVQGEHAAVIAVGERANGEPFAETDFNFLKSLGNLAINSIQKTYFLEERIDKERMEEELAIAKSIQRGLLPNPVPEIEGIDLAAETISSREVGGDYFDIAKTPDNGTIFAIADVTGKGVPAALLMANLQSMLHILLPVDITLSEATERINDLLFKNTPSDKFITFFWGKYMIEHSIFQYVNAGHNPPLLLRNDTSEFEELNEGGLLLGAMQTISPYVQTDIKLNPGDLLVCYTDGVNEAFDPKGIEEYGEERLKACILAHRKKKAALILKEIDADVNQYTDRNFQDDLTLLIIKATE